MLLAPRASRGQRKSARPSDANGVLVAPMPPAPPTSAPLPAATFKASPDDFVVEELPAYAPSGRGEHLFVRFEKRALTTAEAIRRIAAWLEVDPRAAGAAGQKDRVAVTTQTASFPFPIARGAAEPLLATAPSIPGVRVLSAARHDNKLKPGHLAGNRFRIVLRDLAPGAAAAIGAALGQAARAGVPNAYGPQRYGRDGDNPERALAWLSGRARGSRDKREQRFLFSALQSHLFDRVLAVRVAEGNVHTVLPGDLAKKHDSGGMFLVAAGGPDLDDAVRRAERLEISATGPMFGASMRWPEGRPAAIERDVLTEGFGDEARLRELAHLGEGTRRPLRLLPGELVVDGSEPGRLVVGFVLPKGGYATTVLGAVCRLVTPAPRGAGPDGSGDEAAAGAAPPAGDETLSEEKGRDL
jgi:tRNA pseudouridine13 synthase